MGTASFRCLSEKTLRKYEQLERENRLTPRQAKALTGHRLLTALAEAAREAMLETLRGEK